VVTVGAEVKKKMGMHNVFYVGCYLKVYFPFEKIEETKKICDNCGTDGYFPGTYCSLCGGKIVEKKTELERMIYDYDFYEKHFGNGDEFSSTGEFQPSEDYRIVLPNTGRDNLEQLNDYDEVGFTDIPPNEFGAEYQRLMAVLDREGIKYEKCYGIITDYR
jgi:hypothetical protein